MAVADKSSICQELPQIYHPCSIKLQRLNRHSTTGHFSDQLDLVFVLIETFIPVLPNSTACRQELPRRSQTPCKQSDPKKEAETDNLGQG